MIVLQVTNARARRPGYEATSNHELVAVMKNTRHHFTTKPAGVVNSFKLQLNC